MPATDRRNRDLEPKPADGTLATLRARRLAHGSAARLRRSAARLAGTEGLSLACAMLEMISAGEAPAGWPIARMISLLDRPERLRDRQVDRLVADLRLIEAEIHATAEGDRRLPEPAG